MQTSILSNSAALVTILHAALTLMMTFDLQDVYKSSPGECCSVHFHGRHSDIVIHVSAVQ